ncbi:hypothetical protein Q7C36_022190 [Tachysurus vachellii]|uniref:Uncharacterized protein n=1 Tax=Tachysurus vachellii TaxID=175792 RepID=A0AA88LJ26_TACVA|nr:hypothetical protein Q7C36_022190 [Tachysurus vachellii]
MAARQQPAAPVTHCLPWRYGTTLALCNGSARRGLGLAPGDAHEAVVARSWSCVYLRSERRRAPAVTVGEL